MKKDCTKIEMKFVPSNNYCVSAANSSCGDCFERLVPPSAAFSSVNLPEGPLGS